MSEVLPFNIGDEVAVLPGCGDWASDWTDFRLWVAAVHAVPGGGFEYWVSDAWPLPEKPALTDGFYVGVEDKRDTLSLVTRTPAVATDQGVVGTLPRTALHLGRRASRRNIKAGARGLSGAHENGAGAGAYSGDEMILPEAPWIADMRQHFAEHGYYRESDLARLLGNPWDSVTVDENRNAVLKRRNQRNGS